MDTVQDAKITDVPARVRTVKTRINSQLMRVSEHLPTSMKEKLLANTKTGKNSPQQIVRGKLTGNFT